jgi:hypothetical protein
MPGPETKRIYARYYAITREWGPGLLAILAGDPIPEDLQAAGERLRKIWLRVEAEKELRDELDPPKKKTVTWTNNEGETLTIEGYEPIYTEEDPDANDDREV